MSDITICRECSREIKDGQLILEPDFNFATGLHAPENCGAYCILNVNGDIMTDEDELAALDHAVELEKALEILATQGD